MPPYSIFRRRQPFRRYAAADFLHFRQLPPFIDTPADTSLFDERFSFAMPFADAPQPPAYGFTPMPGDFLMLLRHFRRRFSDAFFHAFHAFYADAASIRQPPSCHADAAYASRFRRKLMMPVLLSH